MKTAFLHLAVLLVLFVASSVVSAEERRPNVVVIMADDIGFECYSGYGSEYYQTPHIDRLAKTGAQFTRAYANPICTPSRVKIMTGRYNFRNYTSFGNLDLTQNTFAKVARQAGYATAVAGKWQLSAGNLDGPRQAGFDEYCLWHFAKGSAGDKVEVAPQFADKGGRFKSPRLYQNGNLVADTEGKYGPDIVSDFLCDFIRRSARENPDKPFVAYYPMILVHSPFVPTPDSPDWEKTDKSRKPLEHFRDMVHYMDKVIGKIATTLKDEGVDENTLLIVTGDNGTHTKLVSPFPERGQIRGGKGKIIDDGTHVAFVANWPGTITPGTVIDTPIDFTSILPTVAELAGLENIPNADGQSLVPLLKGDTSAARDWAFVSYSRNGAGGFRCFLRQGDWKLYADGPLVNVPADWLEENPMTGDEVAGRRAAMQALLDPIVADAEKGRVRLAMVPAENPEPKKKSKANKSKNQKPPSD